jgi:hypothetical protein
MQATGKYAGIFRNYENEKTIISFEINELITAEMLEEIKDSKLSIVAEVYKEKRSLNANSYFHVLVGKLADKLRISKPRCKNILLHRYGQPLLLDDDQPAVIKTNIEPDQMLELEEPHCFPCGSKEENGVETTFYKVARNSRTYNTLEMSILIDGTVEECKEQGIETLTPTELAKLKALWGAK